MGNQIVLLVNDIARPGLTAEHGLSIYIEADERKIVLDTGQGKSLLANARHLGLDLAGIDTLVVSHGHYDHTGGVTRLLEVAGHPDLYIHPAAIQPKYAVEDGSARAIHMPEASMVAIDDLPEENLHWVARPEQLTPSIGITGPIPRETDFETPGGPFFLDARGTRPDPIEDDQAVWVNTERGLVVCLGCAHSGVINTLNHVRRLSGQTRIHAVIGGFHLLRADAHRLDQTLAALAQMNPDWVIPCHCTGDRAVARLMQGLGDRVRPGRAGMILEL